MASRISGMALKAGSLTGAVGSGLPALSTGAGAASAPPPTMFSMKTKRLQTLRRLSGVLDSPIPITCKPSSRMRDARRVKSLSDDTSTKPSTLPSPASAVPPRPQPPPHRPHPPPPPPGGARAGGVEFVSLPTEKNPPPLARGGGQTAPPTHPGGGGPPRGQAR